MSNGRNSNTPESGKWAYTLLAFGLGAIFLGALLQNCRPTPRTASAPAVWPAEWEGRQNRAALGYRHSVVSYYGAAHQGRLTASGEVFDKEQLTAAHRWMPFGTEILVGIPPSRWVKVRINDRGPFVKDKRGEFTREFDLSEAAARALGMTKAGIAFVEWREVPK